VHGIPDGQFHRMGNAGVASVQAPVLKDLGKVYVSFHIRLD
jgi:hypothetical protein